MEVLLAFASAGFVICLFWAWNATSHSIKLVHENERLKQRVQELQLAGSMALDMMRVLDKAKPPTPKLDQQTTSLIKLAVGNSNENEARSAAMQACKRLSKQISK